MADVATPAAVTVGTDVSSKPKNNVVKPEKPDEEQYRKDLAEAEKAHKKAQEALVCHHLNSQQKKLNAQVNFSKDQ
jgi:hypothetical protein